MPPREQRDAETPSSGGQGDATRSPHRLQPGIRALPRALHPPRPPFPPYLANPIPHQVPCANADRFEHSISHANTLKPKIHLAKKSNRIGSQGGALPGIVDGGGGHGFTTSHRRRRRRPREDEQPAASGLARWGE